MLFILGDSMLRNASGYELSKLTEHKFLMSRVDFILEFNV